MKTEPELFSFDDLVSSPGRRDSWDGIRNYQARNLMRDDVRKGDLVFIYHSRIPEPAIVGIAEIVKGAYPDPSALDPQSKYFDAKSEAEGQSRWLMVDIKAKSRLKSPMTLAQMRTMEPLQSMFLLQKGQRLSVQPVSDEEWCYIVKTAGLVSLR